jgi:hypothetical protein
MNTAAENIEDVVVDEERRDKDIIEARFSLKDSLSREEWTALFSSVSADTNKS